jgi:negative regulator of flagellin synthesis FlgM
MSSINGIGNSSPASQLQKIVAKPVQKQIPADAEHAGAANSPASIDKVELSGTHAAANIPASLLQTLKSGGDLRAEKVAAIKAQIQAGTYETDDKLDAAADRLLDDLTK